ncbi:MAG: hypothetical protein LUG12_12755 [Erysipelotrichaceae bacterium]|nr:hypothetical protein [Erysipelotrichaceae bacterium]
MDYSIQIDDKVFDNYSLANGYYWYVANQKENINLIVNIRNVELLNLHLKVNQRYDSLFQIILDQLTLKLLKSMLQGLNTDRAYNAVNDFKQIYLDDYSESYDLERIEVNKDIHEIADFLNPFEINRMCDMCAQYDKDNGETKDYEDLALEYMTMPREKLIFLFELKYGYDYHVEYCSNLSKTDKNISAILDDEIHCYKSWKQELAKTNQKEMILERKRKENV